MVLKEVQSHEQNNPVPVARQLLAGKVAVISGGTTGIGRAICLEYLRQGCDVMVNHLGLPEDADNVSSLQAESDALRGSTRGAGRLGLLAGDVREPEACAALVAEAVRLSPTGRLDVCVANAGVCHFADFLEVPADLLTQTLRTNLDGAFYLVQAAARHMARAQDPPGGAIIGISSISALVGGARQVHYTPTKAGVLSMMQSCAVALGPYHIRCNAILPGTILTRLNKDILATPEGLAATVSRTPLGRLGVPSDIAGPAVFLACEELSGFMSGSQVLVDGGMFVNLQ